MQLHKPATLILLLIASLTGRVNADATVAPVDSAAGYEPTASAAVATTDPADTPDPRAEGSWRVDSLRWKGESTASLAGGDNTPFWLTNNTQGLGSLKKNNLRLRASIFKDMDRTNRFSWGAGVDLVGGYRQQSPFAIHQLYGEIRYRCLDLLVGQKELQGELSNPRLSSGNLLYSGNARPIPQIRAGIFDYADIWGLRGWLGIKGYIAFGMFTDSKWVREWDRDGVYAQNVKYHSKGLWLRNGNTKVFPLQFEVGIEMATQFGGWCYWRDPDGNIQRVDMPGGFKSIVKAFVPMPGGSNTINGEQTNVEGNFLGNWTYALSWLPDGADWAVKAYFQHMFEDHSMLYVEYPWHDGLWGVEAKLPRNRVVSNIVYEFLYMKDQTGPVYWDKTDQIPAQVSGRDNYYWHQLYGAWQHWGEIIGNPMILSPIYNDGTMLLRSTRIIGHHLGFEGQPLNELSYRVLASYQRSWGTYKNPLPEVADNFSFLLETTWRPRRLAGWEGKFSFGLDTGNLIGRSAGVQITISKTGLINF
ncbi:MAG: capsule assembly Wzi family protein [Muribaculaceae bacterium]|nr:capsule assembly Wzi family protein [Muribaculaceae bacterium]